MRVYLDNAATTPIDKVVIEKMTETMRRCYGNPSSIHADGRAARTEIEDARKAIAKYIGASIGEVFFTSGGTEANNMVLKNAVRDQKVTRIISSRLEHHAVLHTIDNLLKYNNITAEFVNLDEKGNIDLAHLEALLSDTSQRTLVSLMHANNEIGNMIDLEVVGALCEKYGALFHTDTVQTMGYYPINVQAAKIHYLNGSAHKFHGPKGVGFVFISGDAMLKPFIDGGAQERNMRGGTENLHSIVGMSLALDLAYAQLAERQAHIKDLKEYLKAQLLENFADIYFIGDTEGGHYKVLNVCFPPSPKVELLLFNLDISGISASGGSACSSGAEAGSHVLMALNVPEDRKCIRFSFSHLNTKAEIDFLVEKLKKMTPVLEG